MNNIDSNGLFKKKNNNFQEQLIKEGHQRSSALAHALEKFQFLPHCGLGWLEESGMHMAWSSAASVRQRQWGGQESLERMTKQDEWTKCLKDGLHVLSP